MLVPLEVEISSTLGPMLFTLLSGWSTLYAAPNWLTGS